MLEDVLLLRSPKTWNRLLDRLARRHSPDSDIEFDVRAMLEAVCERGDDALMDYTRRFDCADFSPPLRVESKAVQDAMHLVDLGDRAIIHEAAANIRSFHQAQKQESWFMTRPDGSILGQKVDPVDRAGMYVPGGLGGNTPLISTLLMTVIPAQVAGVREIAITTPPRKDGTVNPYILAAAHILGIEEIYRVGGAWSIAALAYGTTSIKPVDVIAGPGNIWVTTAKRLVQGKVGIDMLAGPSEVLILADETARPDWVAADMLSQAEHDSLASAICLTTDPKLGERILAELAKQCATLPRAEMAAKSLHDWGAVAVMPTLEDAVTLANMIAPEHLEIMTRDPWAVLPGIRHAGAVFMGHHTPESLGDYFAGPNHVLPTVGTARFSSALSVHTFIKRTSVIAASPTFSAQSTRSVARLARLESLEAHARAMETRNPNA